MTTICRFCLKSTGTFFQSLNDHKELILMMIPELNLNLISSPVICDICIKSLHNAYVFKSRCLKSEERIKDLLNGRDGSDCTLYDLLNNLNGVVKRENVDEIFEEAIVEPVIDPFETTSNLSIENTASETVERTKFRCSTCDLDFVAESNFQIHLRGHAGNAFNCLVCFTGFDDELEFIEHSKQHPEVTTQNSRESRNMKRHRRKRDKPNGVPDLNPDNGKEIINSQVSYKRRTRSVANTQKILLQKEDKVDDSSAMDAIEQVIADSNQEIIYACSLCDVTRSTKKEINEHIDKHKVGYRKQCEICGELFEETNSLYEHARTNHMPTLRLVKLPDESVKATNTQAKPNRKRRSKSIQRRPKREKVTSTNNFNELINVLCDELDDLGTPAKFNCEFCDMSFKIYEALEEHMEIHFEGETVSSSYLNLPISCKLCEKRFPDEQLYESHIILHSDATDIYCGKCPLRFISETHYRPHEKYQHGTRCDGCDISFRDGSALMKHVRLCSKKFFCECCDFEADSKQSLHKHAVMHGLPRGEGCPICDFKASNRAALAKHIKQHNSVRDVNCDNCDMSFVSRKDRNAHLNLNEQCRIEDRNVKKFSPKDRLKPIQHQCSLCEEIMPSKDLLLKHKKSHDDVTDIECDHCQLRFCDEAKFCAHLQRQHVICSNCNDTFQNSPSLIEHIQLCPKLKTFICSFCKHKSITFVDHKRHIATEHSDQLEKKYSCTLCDKSFRAKRHLTWHFEQHNIYKDIRCDYCHLRFVSADHHYQHLINHSHKCHFCNAVFECRDDVMEHTTQCKKNPDYIDRMVVYGKGGRLTCMHCDGVFGSLLEIKEHFRMVVML